MTFEQLHHVVTHAADHRVAAGQPAYELRAGFLTFSRRSLTLADRKARVLTAMRELGWPVFLRISEVPFDTQFPGSWGHVARETWAVPREPGSGALLESLLSPGSWQLYLALDAVEQSALPNLFRDPVPAILASVEGLGVPALLQSAAGDRKWRIVLQPAVAERRAAA